MYRCGTSKAHPEPRRTIRVSGLSVQIALAAADPAMCVPVPFVAHLSNRLSNQQLGAWGRVLAGAHSSRYRGCSRRAQPDRHRTTRI
jgi:hypothetical protein